MIVVSPRQSKSMIMIVTNCPFTSGVGILTARWPQAKNLYRAKTTLPLFSFSNRLIPYKRIINMYSVTILRMDYVFKRFKHICHFQS